jgi:chemotaxis signal transduction protein
MSEINARWCVFLPCSGTQSWAVPQNCLAEVVSVPAAADHPPREIAWRGQTLPVLDPGCGQGLAWREPRGGAGLVAVVLGLAGGECSYWGVAVRGAGLGVSRVDEAEIEELPEAAVGGALAAFRLRGVVYQVPDLPALQESLAPRGAGGGDHPATARVETA